MLKPLFVTRRTITADLDALVTEAAQLLTLPVRFDDQFDLFIEASARHTILNKLLGYCVSQTSESYQHVRGVAQAELLRLATLPNQEGALELKRQASIRILAEIVNQLSEREN